METFPFGKGNVGFSPLPPGLTQVSDPLESVGFFASLWLKSHLDTGLTLLLERSQLVGGWKLGLSESLVRHPSRFM